MKPHQSGLMNHPCWEKKAPESFLVGPVTLLRVHPNGCTLTGASCAFAARTQTLIGFSVVEPDILCKRQQSL